MCWAILSIGEMAQRVQSVQEFLQDSFVPLVAALCSEEAERITRKNNLGFCELVKPFCRLTSEGRYRSAGEELGCLHGQGVVSTFASWACGRLPGLLRPLL